jgi:two-component system sensor histidine kinase KdpD
MRGSRRAYGEAVGAVGVTTLVAYLLFPVADLADVVMVYVLGVVVIALRVPRGPAVLGAVLSVAAFDFLFVPPYLTFAVRDVRHLLTFGVMLLVGVVISGLATRGRAQAQAARHREQRTAALYAMTRELAGTRGEADLARIALRHVAEVFDGHATLLSGVDGALVPAAGPAELSAADLATARWAHAQRQPAGPGTRHRTDASLVCVPLLASTGAIGVLALRPADRRAFAAPERLHQLETFAAQTAVALERARLAREAQEAEVRIETERLRNSLLSSVSHDLRTPLATITGAVSAILEGGVRLDARTQQELLESARDEAERLNRLVQNLLEMTRLESGALQLRTELHPPEEVIGAALGRLARRLGDRRVTTRVPADLPLVPMDDVLVEQVLVNLLDNAVKYTPPGSPIEIVATATDGAVTIEVADRGPGLPPAEVDRVFDKFHRGEQGGPRGAGLGLAICRGIVQAHGGRIWAHNLPGQGVAFLFTLPGRGGGGAGGGPCLSPSWCSSRTSRRSAGSCA